MKFQRSILLILVVSLVSLTAVSAQQRFKLLAEHNFKGILSDKTTENIQVLVIHGTGIHKATFADKFMAYTFKKLKRGATSSSEVYRSDEFGIAIQKQTAQYEQGRSLTFYVVHWSEFTKKNKSDLRKMEKKHRAYRGLISKGLKNKVLINQFYDFVVFSNPDFKREINIALDHAFEDMIKQSEHKSSSINLVSGSLGSAIFMEYVYKLHKSLIDSSKIEGFDFKKVENKLDYAKAKPSKFFMLTNQIPFLGPIIAKDDSFGLLKNEDPLQIVAFKHSNDALCFYLPQEVAANFVPYRAVLVTNVRYKNPIRGNLFNKAHKRPFKLKKLHDAILLGSKSPRVKVKP